MLVLYFISAYLLGNLLFGVIIGRILSGTDIRSEGSQNAGARNAGRLYGKKAFVLTFLGDALKGAAVIITGKLLGYSTAVLLAGLLFVCIGHIKPLVFRFKGGKGISTLIGGLIAIHWLFVPIIIVSFFVFYLLYRGFTVPGLLSLTVCAFAFFLMEKDVWSGCLALLLVAVIILAHRVSWREFLVRKTK
ncbi:glycerol-3-phosphate acyltransferase [Niallia sp. FSL R7-0271]|uniref:glycerol-3-phosphate acyltransferase n=1 Tax=Niallia sp. FSL R7-0271 TaxID=2921678 RepID=UPI0030F4C92E